MAPAAPKSREWYLVVSLIAGGGAVAAFIVGNTLFGILLLIGGFAVMLGGSRPGFQKTFALSEEGLHVDERVIPWRSIETFSIAEGRSPKILAVATTTLAGTITAPLIGIDHRAVRTEFKNNNIEEIDEVASFTDLLSNKIGL